MKSSEALPVKQEIEAFSLKEDGEMNASKLQFLDLQTPLILQLGIIVETQNLRFMQEPVFGVLKT